MTTAVPEPRPVMNTMLFVTAMRGKDYPLAAVYLRELFDGCHAEDEGSGEEAGA